MLYKRYANPLSLMGTLSLEGLAGFILRLSDEENEKQLWEIWLHKPIEDDFKTFKQKHYKKTNIQKPLSVDEEKKIIETNMKFIKATNKGGEM